MPAKLLDLPITIANQVLEKLELIDILTSRKVCKSLRTAIDNKFEPRFYKISIELWDKNVSIDFDGIEFNYYDADGGSYVWFNRRQRFVDHESFINVAFHDLKIVLKNVSKLYICRNEKYRQNTASSFVAVLKEDVYIHVKTIALSRFSFDDVLLILPLFKSQSLKEISLWETFEIDQFEQITHLEHWKKSKIFSFRDSLLKYEYIEYFFHFEEFSIYNIDEFPIQSAINVRDNLLQRSTFQKFTLFIVNSNFKPIEVARAFQADYNGGNNYIINYSSGNSNFSIHCKQYSYLGDQWELEIKRQ